MTTDSWPVPSGRETPASGLSEDELLSTARRAYESGAWEESEQHFALLLASSEYEAEARYGLGMLELQRGDERRAASFFRDALSSDPSHANSLYQLGLIAEPGSPEEAQSFYADALQANPAHYGAQQRLRALLGLHASSQRSAAGQSPPALDLQRDAPMAQRDDMPFRSAPAEVNRTLEEEAERDRAWVPKSTPGQAGIVDFLRSDPSPVSRQALDLIAALQVNRRLRFSAELQHILRRLLLIVLPIAAVFAVGAVVSHQTNRASSVFQRSNLIAALGVGAGFWLLSVLVSYLRCTTTRVTIANARLRVEYGILHRRVEILDLWVVTDIYLDRNLFQRITGDGCLTFETPRRHEDKHHNQARFQSPGISGLARGDELDRVYGQLQDLKFVLRSHPVVKGIIQ
jgi:tetratricopeptide (TPR) repeat protein